MDSTFISLQQYEQDLTTEQVLFDHTLDNMSLHEDGGVGTMSELLREKVLSPSRSRFISDESFLGAGPSLFDIPDKSIDPNEIEEYKVAPAQPTLIDTTSADCMLAPAELLGIPMEDESEER